jgi:tetratricopeptide (TPR) repeat protein
MSYSNLGAVYYRLGNYQKALECEEKALTIRLRVYGEAYSNPSIAASYNHLGSAYYSLGEAKQALIYYKKALGMRLQVYGDSHPDVAISYNSLGTAYQSLGDAQKGLECHEKALTIQLQVYGDAHPDVAIHYNNLGEAYRSLGDARKALECQEKALVIQLQAYGDSHPDVALSYEHIGTLFYQDTFNKPEVARTHWLKALFIYRKFKREQGIFRVEKHLANLTSSDALSAGAFRLSPAPLFKEKKGNPEQSLQSSSIISSASSSKPRDFSDYSTTVPMSFNVCSYWNKCKKPLGVAVSAAVVGLAAVYMAR